MKHIKSNKFNQSVLSLNRVDDFFDDRLKYLRLEKNERLEPFPKRFLENFFRTLNSEDLSAYAELGTTYALLSKKFKMSNNNFLLTSGSDLAIKSVIQSLIKKGDEVISIKPGYAMTEIYTKMFGGKVINISLSNSFDINFKKIVSKLSLKTKLVVIENPSGFTGQMPLRSAILKLIKLLNKKNIFILIDEAYIFINKIKFSFYKKVNTFDNLIVCWSFSKAHGLAGMRAGCVISSEENMNIIKNTRPLHEITSLTSNFLKLVISKDKILEDYLKKLNNTKMYIFESLNKLNIKYLNTKTNFFLIYAEDSENLRLFFYKRGILVRRGFHTETLNNWIRICVPPYSKRNFFIKTLRDWKKLG